MRKICWAWLTARILLDMPADLMEQALQDPDNVQEMLDFLALVQKRLQAFTAEVMRGVFRRSLRSCTFHYLYHEGDVVYIGADKYEVIAFDENAVSLRNAEFPLFGKEFSRADFEEKLRENPANDHLKTVITESQKTETLAEEKARQHHIFHRASPSIPPFMTGS
ncbi:MAG: hypothetical protein ACLTGQ_10685 [Mediterraneibacter gnavus]